MIHSSFLRASVLSTTNEIITFFDDHVSIDKVDTLFGFLSDRAGCSFVYSQYESPW